jgi:hypothetical protein
MLSSDEHYEFQEMNMSGGSLDISDEEEMEYQVGYPLHRMLPKEHASTCDVYIPFGLVLYHTEDNSNPVSSTIQKKVMNEYIEPIHDSLFNQLLENASKSARRSLGKTPRNKPKGVKRSRSKRD